MNHQQQDVKLPETPLAGWGGAEFQAASCRLLDEGLRSAASLVPLKALKPNFLHFLISGSQVQTLFYGQVLFERQGYDQKHFYLLHGQLELQFADGHSEIVSGGNALMPLAHHKPRLCTAIARSDCSVLTIDSADLDRTLSWSQVAEYLMADIAIQRNYDEDTAWMQTVVDSNLFLKVPPVNVEQIVSRLTPMVVYEGEVVVRQGEIGDCCYFIKEGRAVVTRRPSAATGDGGLEHLAEIGVGRCFGEDSLVYDRPRNASVTMISDGVLMRLSKRDFMLLLKEPQVPAIPESELAGNHHAPIAIDVRTEDEYSAGHLPGAANIPLNLLCLKKRLLNRDKQYLLYCDTGRRSKAAAHLLECDGYQVAVLAGGLQAEGVNRTLAAGQGAILRNGEPVAVNHQR